MNPGIFNRRITLLQRSTLVRDAMGGLKDPAYEKIVTLWAMQRDKTSTYKQVIGDYVTTNTCYFIVRDVTGKYPVDASWRISYEGYTYVINSITKLNDRPPFYLEIEATRIGGIA